MTSKDFVGREVRVHVNQPLGAEGAEVNRGYLPNAHLQAYVLGVFEPVKSFTGKCIAVIHREEGKDQLVVVPEGLRLSDDEIRLLTWSFERHFRTEIWRE